MFWELVKAKAATQTGGVPDLDVAGFNIIGVIVSIGIPVVFIAVFSLVMAYLFSNLGVSISDAMNVSTFSSNMGGTAWYLLSSFVPVNTLFTLFCARITLQFTLSHLFNIASDAARFIWGR